MRALSETGLCNTQTIGIISPGARCINLEWCNSTASGRVQQDNPFPTGARLRQRATHAFAGRRLFLPWNGDNLALLCYAICHLISQDLPRVKLAHLAFLATTALTAGLLVLAPAQAQGIGASGFGSLPFFSGPAFNASPLSPKWEGSYGRISTGFQTTRFGRGATVSGPTVGLEAGKMWRDGNLVWGVAGAANYEPMRGNFAFGSFGGQEFGRDFSGAARLKAGVLATDTLLFYSSIGVSAGRETWRSGPTWGGTPFSRSDIVVRPEARAGVEWAVTPNLTLGVEVGVVGRMQ